MKTEIPATFNTEEKDWKRTEIPKENSEKEINVDIDWKIGAIVVLSILLVGFLVGVIFRDTTVQDNLDNIKKQKMNIKVYTQQIDKINQEIDKSNQSIDKSKEILKKYDIFLSK